MAESSRAETGWYTHNEALPSLHAKVFWRHLHAPEEGLPARDEVAGTAGDEQQEGQDPQGVDPWVPVLDLFGVYPLALLATLLLSHLVTWGCVGCVGNSFPLANRRIRFSCHG